jgi:signal transduction histidine kinase
MKPRTNLSAAPRRLLVISDHSGFSRDLIARWQMQPQVPEFTALSGDLLRSASGSPFDVSIAGDLQPSRIPEVLGHLDRSLFPAIYVAAAGESVHVLRREYPRITVIPRHDAWLDTLVLVSDEVLKRAEVSTHITRLEQTARLQQTYAALGKYMVEARHGFNNALTSVLGNAELLLLRSESLDEGMQEQLETVHAMTLRLHEMMQRFTSLEQEMQCVEKAGSTEKLAAPLSISAGV